MRLVSPWLLSRLIYPDALFRKKSDKKILYLTFDDGPDPISTPEILSILHKHDIKSVFFCTGAAAERYPELIADITSQGHLLGNHGYDHPDGWKRSCKDYCNNIKKAASLTSDRIFRPPYGRLRLNQYRCLIKNYKIILWDIMPYDFDPELDSLQVLKLLEKKLRPGSIIVFHDSERSNCRRILGSFIEDTLSKGYMFGLPV
jgi:peptidoglycan/xylan/chitin deacetylase (PgdA/CDA1 family)